MLVIALLRDRVSVEKEGVSLTRQKTSVTKKFGHLPRFDLIMVGALKHVHPQSQMST